MDLLPLLNDRNWHLIVLPTEQCNFRCTYCYEDFAVGRMPEPVVNGLMSLIDRRAESVDWIGLDWFGGEPLVARDLVVRIGSHARKAAARTGARFASGMTTNAWALNTATASLLLDEAGVTDYQVSLDGIPAEHNLTRIRRGGGETWDRIWTNLLRLRDSSLGIKVILRVHITAANVGSIPTLATLLFGTFAGDRRFSVLPKRIGRWGGPNDASLQIASASQVDDATNLLSNALPVNMPPEVCYAGTANSLVVRADGRIGKCTVALADTRNTVGRLKPDGSLEIDQDRLSPWLRGIETLDPDFLQCPLMKLPRLTETQPA